MKYRLKLFEIIINCVVLKKSMIMQKKVCAECLDIPHVISVIDVKNIVMRRFFILFYVFVTNLIKIQIRTHFFNLFLFF